ncbi:hypothetical protein PybrP1_012345 [[Pythium] brassicae (nom. inval.)]|nr:hypothetical protein PybrP1_012345 [[Pythium] brassicae (nom. inval.)]
MNATSTARAAQTAVDRASAEQLDISIISESYRCQYPSKHCANDRSVKRDGDLHKFCEFHRSKANRNQRKLEQKKKLEGKLDEQYGLSIDQARRFDIAPSQQPSDLLVGLHLDEEDLRVLAAVLSVDQEGWE